MIHQLLSDDTGFVVSIELILISTIAVLGLIAGLSTMRNAAISELSDVAGALQDVNQCFRFAGLTGHSGRSHGSDFSDQTDFCDDADDPAGSADNCITFDGDPADETESGSTGGGVGAVTVYENSDTTTDISASQNDTTLKWELEPGQEEDADAISQAIVDCIEAGHVAVISWTDVDGTTHAFKADTIVSGGPENFAFGGASSGSASGKLGSATVTCEDGG